MGCGAGNYINDLQGVGFKRSEGIDPFIDGDMLLESGAKIRKLYVEEVKEKYDIVFSHHSLEHVPDPRSFLAAMKNCLKEDGVMIVTVPVAEELYRMFRENCYIIQAPQHFFLFSLRSIEILSEQVGLEIVKVIREIDTNLDWCKISYLWSQDKTLNEVSQNLDSNIPVEKLREYQLLISDGKENGLGDNVTYIMRKSKEQKM